MTKKNVFNFLFEIASFCDERNLGPQSTNREPDLSTLVLGPVSSPIERKLGKYRGQILLLNTNKKKLHSLINKLDLYLEKNVINKMVKWQIDIDPLDMS